MSFDSKIKMNALNRLSDLEKIPVSFTTYFLLNTPVTLDHRKKTIVIKNYVDNYRPSTTFEVNRAVA